MSVRLNINGTDVGFDDNLPISINKSVADIRDPGKRNSGYSKTIVIPGTPEANKLFEFIFQVNVESNQFNPNVKTPASYYVNEVRVFKGDLQILNINKTFNGLQEQVEYECSIVGENGNLFLDITGLYLTDIDFSDLDHPFVYGSGLFNPTLGEGYCYPYIDYGLRGSRVSDEWTFEHLKPAIFEKEYIDRIFADAGYTYTSDYLNSTYAKSIIIPDVNAGALQLPAATVANNQFYAGMSSGDVNPVSLTYVGSNIWGGTFSEAMPFDDDSGDPFFDPGGVYNTATFRFTPSVNGTFQLTATASITMDVNMPAGAIQAIGSYTLGAWIQKSTDGGSSWSNVGQGAVGNETFNNTWPRTYSFQPTVPPTLVTQPCIFRVLIFVSAMSMEFRDVFNAPVTSGTASYDFDYSGTFGAVMSTANLPSGSTVAMNDTIPQNVTQLDFLTSIIKLENLYFEPDPDNPRNYIIEPREDFITDEAVDWSAKIDYSKPIKIQPMGELDVKKYVFTYKSDKDHYNKLYEDEYKEVYGTETVDVDSDFVRGEKRIEVVFSATPTASADDVTVAGGLVDIVAPRFFSSNGDLSEVSPMKCNIRRLYWGGLISCNSHTLIKEGYWDPITSSFTSSTDVDFNVQEYPFAGHVDHPMEPTVDLCWDNPFKLYWIFPQQTYTNNQRYGARWSKFISEITDRDSKIVTAYVYLNEVDMYQHSFRKKSFFDGTYYFVNEIKDYDPQDEKSIPVEFLKLQTGPTFTPLSIGNINDVLGGGGGMNSARTGANMNMRMNYGSGVSYGFGNINNDPSALIIGNNNYVG